MPLTSKEIVAFARSAVEDQSDIFRAPDAETKAKRLLAHRKAACAYYLTALTEIEHGGFRVTQRVKDATWAELLRIETEAKGEVA